MKCQRFHDADELGSCARRALYTVEGIPLCTRHAGLRPLQIVLSDPVKWDNWIKVARVPEGQFCQYRSGCLHKHGDGSSSDAPRPAKFTVAEGPPLCRHHAAKAVWGEALFDTYLSKLIKVAPFRGKQEGGDDDD